MRPAHGPRLKWSRVIKFFNHFKQNVTVGALNCRARDCVLAEYSDVCMWSSEAMIQYIGEQLAGSWNAFDYKAQRMSGSIKFPSIDKQTAHLNYVSHWRISITEI
jgi:hypothetical protein